MHGISKEIDVQMKHNGTVQSRESELAGFTLQRLSIEWILELVRSYQ